MSDYWKTLILCQPNHHQEWHASKIFVVNEDQEGRNLNRTGARLKVYNNAGPYQITIGLIEGHEHQRSTGSFITNRETCYKLLKRRE